MKPKIKILNISLAIAFIFSILLSLVTFEAQCDDLRQNVFRLHIIANSDSEEDQALKLKVRDAILKESEALFGDSRTLEDAILSTRKNLPLIESVAQKAIEDNGYDYSVRVSVKSSFFDTRVYDEFMLPAGVYEALKIEIGEAKGKIGGACFSRAFVSARRAAFRIPPVRIRLKLPKTVVNISSNSRW